MKKFAVIIGLLVAGNILFAQDRREEIRERRAIKIEEYKSRLELTEKQITELKNLRESAKPQLKEIRNDDSKSRSDIMRAHADIMEAHEKELANILNEKQLEELEVIKKEVKERRKHRIERRQERRKDGN